MLHIDREPCFDWNVCHLKCPVETTLFKCDLPEEWKLF